MVLTRIVIRSKTVGVGGACGEGGGAGRELLGSVMNSDFLTTRLITVVSWSSTRITHMKEKVCLQ